LSSLSREVFSRCGCFWSKMEQNLLEKSSSFISSISAFVSCDGMMMMMMMMMK
jgi:hypothetical protein